MMTMEEKNYKAVAAELVANNGHISEEFAQGEKLETIVDEAFQHMISENICTSRNNIFTGEKDLGTYWMIPSRSMTPIVKPNDEVLYSIMLRNEMLGLDEMAAGIPADKDEYGIGCAIKKQLLMFSHADDETIFTVRFNNETVNEVPHIFRTCRDSLMFAYPEYDAVKDMILNVYIYKTSISGAKLGELVLDHKGKIRNCEVSNYDPEIFVPVDVTNPLPRMLTEKYLEIFTADYSFPYFFNNLMFVKDVRDGMIYLTIDQDANYVGSYAIEKTRDNTTMVVFINRRGASEMKEIPTVYLEQYSNVLINPEKLSTTGVSNSIYELCCIIHKMYPEVVVPVCETIW